MTALRPLDEDLDTATHQLLNGLTTVRGRAQLVHRQVQRLDPSHPDVLLASLGRIIEAADRLVQVVSELRDRRRPPSTDDTEAPPPPP